MTCRVLWVNIISRCAFEHKRAALYFTFGFIIPTSSIRLCIGASGDLLGGCLSVLLELVDEAFAGRN